MVPEEFVSTTLLEEEVVTKNNPFRIASGMFLHNYLEHCLGKHE